jgi:hypothetical protein
MITNEIILFVVFTAGACVGLGSALLLGALIFWWLQ